MNAPGSVCPQRTGGRGRPRSVLLVSAVLCSTLMTPGAGWVFGGDSDLEHAGYERLKEVIQSRPPTPELTEQLRSKGAVALLARIHVVERGTGVGLLNALHHALALGSLTRREWHGLRRVLRCDACVLVNIEETHEEIRPVRGPHAVLRSLTLRPEVVFAGSILLTPENTPLSVIFHDQGRGKTSEDFARLANAKYVMCLQRVDGGYLCNEAYMWPYTGREEEVFSTAAPLLARNAQDVMNYMRSEDEVWQWLGTVQALLGCRYLEGAPWDDRAPGYTKESALKKRREVIRAFAQVANGLVWDQERDAFERGEDTSASRQR